MFHVLVVMFSMSDSVQIEVWDIWDKINIEPANVFLNYIIS